MKLFQHPSERDFSATPLSALPFGRAGLHAATRCHFGGSSSQKTNSRYVGADDSEVATDSAVQSQGGNVVQGSRISERTDLNSGLLISGTNSGSITFQTTPDEDFQKVYSAVAQGQADNKSLLDTLLLDKPAADTIKTDDLLKWGGVALGVGVVGYLLWRHTK